MQMNKNNNKIEYNKRSNYNAEDYYILDGELYI